MFDIGFQELIIIFLVALLVFGPKKLPELGRTLGKWFIEIRRGIHNAKVQMETEFDEIEKKPANDIDKLPLKEEKPTENESDYEETGEKV